MNRREFFIKMGKIVLGISTTFVFLKVVSIKLLRNLNPINVKNHAPTHVQSADNPKSHADLFFYRDQ